MNTSSTHPAGPDVDRTAVIVGVDGSEAAADAARAAGVEAAARQVPLVLVHAFDWPTGGVDGLSPDVDGRAVARRSAASDLQRLAVSITKRLPKSDVRTELLEGAVVDVLCRRSADAALLVVGAHGQTWRTGSALGAVASAVAQGSVCPVLVHRTVNPLAVHHTGVTVGVDGGPGSRQVLATAAGIAQRRGVALTVVHTCRQLTQDATRTLRWLPGSGATSAAEAAHVEGLVAELHAPHPELRVDVVQLPGRAGPALVEAGDAAALLVIGRPATGDGQGSRATTHEVSSRALVPVLLVPLPATDVAAPEVPVLADRV